MCKQNPQFYQLRVLFFMVELRGIEPTVMYAK